MIMDVNMKEQNVIIVEHYTLKASVLLIINNVATVKGGIILHVCAEQINPFMC